VSAVLGWLAGECDPASTLVLSWAYNGFILSVLSVQTLLIKKLSICLKTAFWGGGSEFNVRLDYQTHANFRAIET
jgi:hypothetical protein